MDEVELSCAASEAAGSDGIWCARELDRGARGVNELDEMLTN